MGVCSLVRMTSLLQLDLRTLRTLLALSSTPSSQGKFRINSPFVLMETETVVEILPETSLMETETVVETLPELPLDVLMYIFALLEIPDLIRAGSVCSFWHSAYSTLHNQLGQYKRLQTPCLLSLPNPMMDAVAPADWDLGKMAQGGAVVTNQSFEVEEKPWQVQPQRSQEQHNATEEQLTV
ncbi:hypothetical protein ZWY2020_006956 [Hordeum vulgare]|nr:hypothetical protein ZWY2020_006956 [Hordeum vulgare]